MSDQIEMIGRIRARSGTSLVRRLRREGDVPAVLYGGDKENLSIAVNHDVLYHNLEREEFSSAIIVLNIDGNKEQAILRSVQRHPHKIDILHADFMRVDEKQELTMTMPIHFIGEEEAKGVREGGIVSHLINDVEISCLPKDLPEHIELDVSGLDMNESLHLSDIKLGEGVTITALAYDDTGEHDYAVVTILPPRVEVEPEEETEAVDAVAEEGEESAEDEGGDSEEQPEES